MTLRAMALLLGLGGAVACGHVAGVPAPAISAEWQEHDPLVHFSGDRLPAESTDHTRIALLAQGDIATSGDPWGALIILDVHSGLEIEHVALVGSEDWSSVGGQPQAVRPRVDKRLADANGRLAAWGWRPLMRIAPDKIELAEPHLTVTLHDGRHVGRAVPSITQPGCDHPAHVVGAWAGEHGALVQIAFRGDIESRCGQPNDVYLPIAY